MQRADIQRASDRAMTALEAELNEEEFARLLATLAAAEQDGTLGKAPAAVAKALLAALGREKISLRIDNLVTSLCAARSAL